MTAPHAGLARKVVLPVDGIRAQFPALVRRENGSLAAYFDGPGGTQTPRAVADALCDYLYHHNANTHWEYPVSHETDAALRHARQVYSGFLNCDPCEVAFGANMTTLTLHVSRALGLAWGSGDEVVVTELDHHANIDPWRALERERGITVRTARMNPASGDIDWDHLASLIGERTRLVAVGAASNALGTVTDVTAAVTLARAVGALVFVDGVHYSQHELPDVRALGCDFFACSAYKFYGPHVGVLYARTDVLEAMPFASLEPAAQTGPERAETGTLNHEGIVGAGAAVEWMAALAGGDGSLRERLITSFMELHERSSAQFHRLWGGLSETRGVRLYGQPPGPVRMPTVGFTVDGVTASEVNRRLAAGGLFLSHGNFYALSVIRRLGLEPEGLVRAGCACYTTDDEVDRLVESVRRIALTG